MLADILFVRRYTNVSSDTCQPPTDSDYAEGLKKRQIVMEFDMATWKVSPEQPCMGR